MSTVDADIARKNREAKKRKERELRRAKEFLFGEFREMLLGISQNTFDLSHGFIPLATYCQSNKAKTDQFLKSLDTFVKKYGSLPSSDIKKVASQSYLAIHGTEQRLISASQRSADVVLEESSAAEGEGV